MKGKLHKTEQGWVVEYAKHSEILLHPEYVKYYFLDEDAEGGEVEFEIVSDTYEKPGKGNTYAKLIPSKEQQKQLITEIMNEDAKDALYDTVNDTVNDVEKLAKERTDAFVKMYNTHLEIRQYAFAKGFIEGYNKAKEETESIFANILDHLCDKMESISQEQIDKDSFQLARYRTFKYIFEYIQSLNKQPIETKETLYTEEQVKEIVEKSRETGLTAEYLMLSLKQPKKD